MKVTELIIAIVLVAAMGCGSSGATDPCLSLHPTDSPPTVCSQVGTQDAGITFANDCTTLSVKTYWVDYQCTEKYYQTLKPGDSYLQQTYVTHPWRIRDAASGKLLKDVPPPTSSQPYTVTVP